MMYGAYNPQAGQYPGYQPQYGAYPATAPSFAPQSYAPQNYAYYGNPQTPVAPSPFVTRSTATPRAPQQQGVAYGALSNAQVTEATAQKAKQVLMSNGTDLKQLLLGGDILSLMKELGDVSTLGIDPDQPSPTQQIANNFSPYQAAPQQSAYQAPQQAYYRAQQPQGYGYNPPQQAYYAPAQPQGYYPAYQASNINQTQYFGSPYMASGPRMIQLPTAYTTDGSPAQQTAFAVDPFQQGFHPYFG